jgi:hypothetical protein
MAKYYNKNFYKSISFLLKNVRIPQKQYPLKEATTTDCILYILPLEVKRNLVYIQLFGTLLDCIPRAILLSYLYKDTYNLMRNVKKLALFCICRQNSRTYRQALFGGCIEL